MNAARILQRAVDSHPEATTIVDAATGDRYSDAEWDVRVAAIAGPREPRDRTRRSVDVGIGNRPEAGALYWAIQSAASYATFNIRSASTEGRVVFDRLEPAVVVSAVDEQAVLGAIDDDTDLVDIGADPPDAALAWGEFVSRGGRAFEPTFVDAGPESVVFQTSGTTGRPKSVPHTHRSAYTTPQTIAFEARWRHGDSILAVLPLYHMAGLQTLTTCTLANGTWIAQSDFSIEAVMATVHAERPTYRHSVPTDFHGIVDHEDSEDCGLDAVEKVQYAGALVTEPLQRRVRAVFEPEEFINYYGSSKLHYFAVCTWLDQKPTCTGRACIDTRLRVFDPTPSAPGEAVDEGELGEGIVDASSPGTFAGYIDDPAETEASFRDGWYYTGDLGYLDAERDLWLVGRVDDMVISGGEQIAPIEDEAALEGHDQVGDVAVTGEPDEKWGQVLVAFVTPPLGGIKEFAAAASALDGSLRAGETLADFERQRRYVFVHRLPTSDVGEKLWAELADRPEEDVLATVTP